MTPNGPMIEITEDGNTVHCHQTQLRSVTAVFGALFSGNLEYRSRSQRISQKQRPCINCGKEHTHNNAFCSGDCCRAHKKAQQ